MNIEVRPTGFEEIESLRGLYRQEANCQIIKDSILRRGLADPYLILVDGHVGGYGGVWNATDSVGRVMEFYALPDVRAAALPMFRELIAVSGARGVEAQTNIPLLLLMLMDCADDIRAEAVLFEDARSTHIECPEGILRRVGPGDADRIFPHQHEPVGEWIIEVAGEVVATGGALHHYNPPYADLFMEVSEAHRQHGYGSYLVQEMKRICYEGGHRPAARCGADNVASRATLQKAGFLPCGRLLVGEVLPSA